MLMEFGSPSSFIKTGSYRPVARKGDERTISVISPALRIFKRLMFISSKGILHLKIYYIKLHYLTI